MTSVDGDEDDFMSDKFLQQAEKADKAREPQNPLQMKRKLQEENTELGQAAKRARLESDKASHGTLTARMERARNEGLAASIPATNIGHKLLAKMGYLPGQGLGKDKQGRAEPVPVAVKHDKLGLGVESKQRRQEKRVDRTVQAREELSTQFRSVQKLRFDNKRLVADFVKCKSVCEHLDRASGIEHNPLWSAPAAEDADHKESNGAATSDSSSAASSSSHSTATKAPSHTHAKPVAAAYDPEAALNAPDSDEDDDDKAARRVRRPKSWELAAIDSNSSSSSAEPASRLPAGAAEAEAEELTAEQMAQTLADILTYLRSKHVYCFFCAVRFDDAEDMQRSCPGPFLIDHQDSGD